MSVLLIMKIGLYDPYLDTMSGGEKYMLQAAICLSKMHNVTIFWDKTDVAAIKTEAKRKFNIDLSHVAFVQNIFDKNIGLLTRLVESRKYDNIIVLSDGSIPLIGCKLILHFQSPVEWVSSDSLKLKIKKWNMHQVICNSTYTKNYIDKKFHVSSSVIYPPVGVTREQKDHVKENIILNVGRYGIKTAGSSYKKQEAMIDIFKKMIDKKLKGWELHLLISILELDIQLLKELKMKAEGYPIKFIINAGNQELWGEYAKAKIYWHAAGYGEDLHRYPDRAEHFGISTVEAMAMGAVPIVINAGGQPEIVQDGKSGLLWSTEHDLIDRTTQVVENKKLWSTLSENAKERAKIFDNHHFCDKLNSLIS